MGAAPPAAAGRRRRCCLSRPWGDQGLRLAQEAAAAPLPRGEGLYDALSAVLDRVEAPLERIEAEDAEETAALRALLVRTLVGLVDWKAAEVSEHNGNTFSFLRVLCKQRLPYCIPRDVPQPGFERAALRAYHTGLCARYPAGRVGVVSLMRAVLQDHRQQCDCLSEALPGVGTALAAGLDHCLGLNLPGVSDETLLALERPAVVAFSFGTGLKIGPAERLPALVGPSCETPGSMNCALAATVGTLLRRRPMPVYAQWEVADALLYGPEGCPEERAAGYREGDFGLYPLVEDYEGRSVYKSVPSWPEERKRRQFTLEQMGSPEAIQQFYLSTNGVMKYFGSLWAHQPSLRPSSIVVVAFPDHTGRCMEVVRSMMRNTEGGEVPVVAVPADCYPAWQHFRCNAVTGYDPASTQSWTTSRTTFLVKEVTIRLATGIWHSSSAATAALDLGRLLGLK